MHMNLMKSQPFQSSILHIEGDRRGMLGYESLWNSQEPDQRI